MKKYLFIAAVGSIIMTGATAQDLRTSQVPANVKAACMQKFPQASKDKIAWEKEKGNYEANWGGKSGEDNSAMFTPTGTFVEIVKAIPVSQLPASVAKYVKEHENGAKISEAGLVTSADGTVTYEAEVKGKDLIFSKEGTFIKKD